MKSTLLMVTLCSLLPATIHAQWFKMTDGDVFAFAKSASDLFAGTTGGVLLSTDEGTTWTAVNTGLPTDPRVRALAVSGGNLFAGCYVDGVFLSTDNGASWSNTGFQGTNVTAFAVLGTNLFVGTGGFGVYLSADNGTSWTTASAGLTPDVRCLAVSGSNLFAGTYGGDAIYLSTNNGTSWTAVNTGLTTFVVHALAVSDTNLIAGARDGTFLSTDNGANWTLASPKTEVRALAVSDTSLFAGFSGSGVDGSTNGGTSWFEGYWNGGRAACRALCITTSYLFFGDENGAWRRSLTELLPEFYPPRIGSVRDVPNDQGGKVSMLWSRSSLDITAIQTITEYRVWRGVRNALLSIVWEYVGSSPAQGFPEYSYTVPTPSDSGPQGNSMYYFRVSAQTTTPETSFFSKPDSGYSVNNLLIGVDDDNQSVVSSYSLSQNYPNPFNPSTTIRYALPERSHVTLTVFNALGQQVATLVQAEQEAGYHEVQYEASSLASGVYPYRLQAGDFAQTRRLVLLR